MLKTIFLSLIISTTTFATTDFDKHDELQGVMLRSGKEDTLRTYIGSMEKTYSFPLSVVQKAVTSFTNRCNNSFRSKRKFTDENFECKYHSENIVETFVVEDVNKLPAFAEYSDYYLLGRNVYNRSSSGFYELVTIKESMNEKNQKVVTIAIKMLQDSEVAKFTTPKFTRETAFEDTMGVFTLTEVSPTQTQLIYDHKASTTHWLLNKEILVPQVFVSLSRNINQLFKTVEQESSTQKREVASKQ